ncbi:MAG TPA: hypothetical protein VKE70_13485 [Candidatus Solibacter sp.]|nr:hypothetical protein [Candidatus Solibacter sp.]
MQLWKLFAPIVLGAAPAVASDLDFGLSGITPVETARLSAFCPGDSPCDVTFVFHDIRGGTLKRTAITLEPGTGGSMDLTVSEAGVPVNRLEIVPCVLVGRGDVIASYQVFDNFTLRTRIFRNWGGPPEPAAGEIHFGTVGITPFDTSRLNVICSSDPIRVAEPCDVTFIFHDTRNQVLKQSTRTFDPGAAAFLDFRAAEAGLTTRHGEIIPCVRVGRGSVLATVETIDSLTGVTIVLAHAAALAAP